jgi:hypothetical protein
MKLAKLFVVSAMFVSLSSCVEVRAELTFRTPQTGTLALNYRIDSRALEIGMFDPDATILPLPVARRDFERTASAIGDLELRSYRMRRQNGTTIVDAEYAFWSAAALSTLFAESTPISIETADGQTLFRHRVFDGFPAGVGDSAAGFVDSFLSGGRFSIQVTTPTPILRNSAGVLDNSERTVRLEYTTSDLLMIRDPIVWEVVW